MVIPTAVADYCPDAARAWTRDEREAIGNLKRRLNPNVRFVPVYQELLMHIGEPIYLRTDHHWAPLAAYYAARRFARDAGVPFKSLADYDTLTVKNFVGTMFNLSKDNAVKRSPEDFVYYVPRDTAYTATFY